MYRRSPSRNNNNETRAICVTVVASSRRAFSTMAIDDDDLIDPDPEARLRGIHGLGYRRRFDE